MKIRLLITLGFFFCIPRILEAQNSGFESLVEESLSEHEYWVQQTKKMTVKGRLRRTNFSNDFDVTYELLGDKRRWTFSPYSGTAVQSDVKSSMLKTINVATPTYFFSLTQTNPQADFVLANCHRIIDEETKNRVWVRQFVEMDVYLNSPVFIYDISIKEILRQDGWRIDSIHRTNDGIIQVEAVYVAEKFDHERAKFSLDPRLKFGLLSFELIFKKSANGHVNVYRGSVNYETLENHEPRLKSVNFRRTTYPNRSLTSATRESEWNLDVLEIEDQCSSEIFDLDYYGFPAGLLKPENSGSLFWKLVTLFIFFILCALFIRHFLKRRVRC